MGITVAELTAKLVMDTKEFIAGAKDAEKAVTTFEDRLKKMGDSAKDLGKKMSLNVTAPIVAGFTFATHALMEHEKHQALVEAHIKSTGGVAGVTAAHIEELTGSLSKLSGASKGSITDGQAMLLTFTQIRNEAGEGNDIFDRTTKAVLDMSTAMGSDMQTAAIQVGKAMQNPIEGVTALQRVGVRLTETQKQQVAQFVKMGDIVSAQKIILGELNTEFGGTAAMMGKTMVGDMGRMQQSFRDAGSAMATTFAPALMGVAHAVTGLAEMISGASPAVKMFATGFLIVAAVIGPTLSMIGKMATGAAALSGWFQKLFGSATAAAAGEAEVAAAQTTLLGVTEALLAAVQGIAAALGAEGTAAASAAVGVDSLAVATEAAAIGEDAAAVGADVLAVGLDAEAIAADTAAIATDSFAVALSAVLGPIGLIAVGISLVMQVFNKLKSASADAKKANDDLTRAILQGGDAATLATAKFVVEQTTQEKVTNALKKTGISIHDYAAAMQDLIVNGYDKATPATKTLIDHIHDLSGIHSKVAGSAQELDKVLFDGVSTQRTSADAADKQREAYEGTGVAIDKATGAAELNTGAVRDSSAAAETNAQTTLKMADAQMQANSAALQLKQTLWQIVDAQRAVKGANLEAAAQSIALKQAQQSTVDAGLAVTKARREEANATLELARAEQEYQYALTNANNAVIASMLGLQKAFSDVAYAQILLDRAPGMQARREQDAADGVTAAYIAQRKATDDVAAAQRALDALPVTHARLVAEAADKVTAAYITQRGAITGTILAQQAYDQVTSASHAQSLADGVTSAIINQTRAHDGVTIAQRAATQAGKDLSATQKEIKQVMAGNTEHLSDFAKTLKATYATALDATQRFKADTAISLEGLTSTLQANLADFASWQDNLQKLAAGGHKGLAQELAKMGPSAANAVAQAVVASGPELDKLQALYAEKSKFEASPFAMKQAKGMGDSGIDTDYLKGLKAKAKDQQQAKKEAQQDVTLAAIAARKADDDVNKALQDQANLWIDIQAKADAVTTATLAEHAAQNGITDALQHQQDLLTGPLSLAAQTVTLTDALTSSQLALTQSGYAVADAVTKQVDTLAKLGPFEDLAVVASRGFWEAQANLDTVSQSLTHSLQGQNDLMNKVGPTIDPVTAAQWHLADATAGVNSALYAQQAAANSYAKSNQTIQSSAEITSRAVGNLNGVLDQALGGILGRAESMVTGILESKQIIPGGETGLQHLQAKIIAMQNIINSGDIPMNSPLMTMVQGQLALLKQGVGPGVAPLEMGGRATKGLAYLVGEKRPEVFVPDQSGTVIPSLRQFMQQTRPYTPAAPSYAAHRGGDTYYHIPLTVQGQVLTERDLVNTVHEGLKAKNRQSGSLGFS